MQPSLDLREPAGRLPAAFAVVVALYLGLAWFGGGPTLDVTPLDEWLSLLAWVPIVMAGAALIFMPPQGRLARIALVAAIVVPLVPLFQLATLPEALLRVSPAREAVSADLAIAGVTTGPHAWSLWPETTLRSLNALLPALACFLGALVVGEGRRSMLALVALGLVLANLVFGFFQVGLPVNSAMRLYSDNGSGFGGVFVNGNHQATALIIGMLLALGLCARESRWRRDRGQPRGGKTVGFGAAALVCLAAVPLAGSSAGMIIAVVAFGVGVVATGLVKVRRIRRNPMGMAALLGAIAILVVGLVSVQRWMDLRSSDAMRYGLAREVLVLGNEHAPFGSGGGTFVDAFAQAASRDFQRIEYVNHAHNEYAQWWLEAGWPGILLIILVLGVLATAGWRLLRTRPRDPIAVACWLAVACVLVHSLVDFPLRTTALMSMTALLAGFAIATASRPFQKNTRLVESGSALQKA
jgi:O-antigen ligase